MKQRMMCIGFVLIALIVVQPVRAQSQSIDAADLSARLAAQVSYRFTFAARDTTLTGRHINHPNSWVLEGGADIAGITYTTIGARDWVELPGLFLTTCAATTGNHIAADGCSLGQSGVPLIQGTIGYLFSPRTAEFVEEAEFIGIPAFKYQAVDESGEIIVYLIDQEFGLPLSAETGDLRLEFWAYNDPGNVILAPTHGMPQTLIAGDALIQLYAQESFRYTYEADIRSGGSASAFTIEGGYRPQEQAWYGRWSWVGGDSPSFELLSQGTDQRIKFEDRESWIPAALIDAEHLFMLSEEYIIPLAIWSSVTSDTILTQDSGADRTVNGVTCHNYSGAKESNTATLSMLLCVTPEMFPVEVVVDGADPAQNFTLHARQVFSTEPVEIPTP